jgi:hypothetical protein
MTTISKSRLEDGVQLGCEDSVDCGSCQYQVQNGVWTRVGTGECTTGCSCPQHKSDAEVFWSLLLCCPIVDSQTMTSPCTTGTAVRHPEPLLLKLTEGLADKLPIRDRVTLIYVRQLIQKRVLWQRLAISLGVVTSLLIATLAYVLITR